MDTSARYHICVHGYLGERWLASFDQHTVTYREDGRTMISVTVVDQAHLFGLINRVRDLGLELILVQKDEPVANHCF